MKLEVRQKVVILQEPGVRFFPEGTDGDGLRTRCSGRYPVEAEIEHLSSTTATLKIRMRNPNSGYMERTTHTVWRWALTAHHVDVFDLITI